MVKVGFRSYDARVLPEMSAKVLFLTKTSDSPKESVRSILTIPLNAVATRAGGRVVYVIRDNRAVEVPVTVGKEFGSQTEITQGLSAGDRVIAAVTEHITNGTPVKVQ
jgi:hypothetical protein